VRILFFFLCEYRAITGLVTRKTDILASFSALNNESVCQLP
jgi:hypothetical protein